MARSLHKAQKQNPKAGHQKKNKQNAETKVDHVAKFIPAPDGFAGPRPGYYFGAGSSGIGYYHDPSVKKK